MSISSVFNTVYDLYSEYVNREYVNRNIENEIDGEYTENYDNYFSDCHTYLMRLINIFYDFDDNTFDYADYGYYYDLCTMIF